MDIKFTEIKDYLNKKQEVFRLKQQIRRNENKLKIIEGMILGLTIGLIIVIFLT